MSACVGIRRYPQFQWLNLMQSRPLNACDCAAGYALSDFGPESASQKPTQSRVTALLRVYRSISCRAPSLPISAFILP